MQSKQCTNLLLFGVESRRRLKGGEIETQSIALRPRFALSACNTRYSFRPRLDEPRSTIVLLWYDYVVHPTTAVTQ